VSAQMQKEATLNSLEMDREVIRCKTCGLVQYRTRTGNCRRCVRALPQRMEYLIPQEPPQEQEAAEVLTPKFPNQETVENIGQRIRQLRESRTMTQSQLQARSKVSRSYLSRIESGQMTPSLGTLEKISEALNVGLNRFFIPESDGEALLEDPFIQGLRPFLRQLDWEQWQSAIMLMRRPSRSALSVTRHGCRSPRRRMATGSSGTSDTPAIRMGSYPRKPMASRRATRCGVPECPCFSVPLLAKKYLASALDKNGAPKQAERRSRRLGGDSAGYSRTTATLADGTSSRISRWLVSR